MNMLVLLPRSNIIPISPFGEPVVPLPNSISLSEIVVFVLLTVVVVPLTVRLPPIVKLPDKELKLSTYVLTAC